MNPAFHRAKGLFVAPIETDIAFCFSPRLVHEDKFAAGRAHLWIRKIRRQLADRCGIEHLSHVGEDDDFARRPPHGEIQGRRFSAMFR